MLKVDTNQIRRIKIGIGRDERYNVSDWVLSQFTKEEEEILREAVYHKVIEYLSK